MRFNRPLAMLPHDPKSDEAEELMGLNSFVSTPTGLERRSWGEFIVRHRHRCPYASIVLGGGYEEAGDRGRHFVKSGDVVLHGPFEAHLDRFTSKKGAKIFGFELPETFTPSSSIVCVRDPEFVMRIAAQNSAEALLAVLAGAKPESKRAADWPDLLAEALLGDPKQSLGGWADLHALAPATISRGFRQVYGISPNAFRAQARARLAWRRLVDGRDTLASVAVEAGFADQAHMTRAVLALTAQTPGAWRGKVK